MTCRVYQDGKYNMWYVHLLNKHGSIVRVEWFATEEEARRWAREMEDE